ncbi:MAG: hypothetical protein ACXVCO_01185 [Ktedonobacterales bacterium]
MEKYIIELKFYPDNDDQKDAIRTAARQAAKHLQTIAAVVSSGERPPEIALTSNNFFEGSETISLADDLIV